MLAGLSSATAFLTGVPFALAALNVTAPPPIGFLTSDSLSMAMGADWLPARSCLTGCEEELPLAVGRAVVVRGTFLAFFAGGSLVLLVALLLVVVVVDLRVLC